MTKKQPALLSSMKKQPSIDRFPFDLPPVKPVQGPWDSIVIWIDCDELPRYPSMILAWDRIYCDHPQEGSFQGFVEDFMYRVSFFSHPIFLAARNNQDVV